MDKKIKEHNPCVFLTKNRQTQGCFIKRIGFYYLSHKYGILSQLFDLLKKEDVMRNKIFSIIAGILSFVIIFIVGAGISRYIIRPSDLNSVEMFAATTISAAVIIAIFTASEVEDLLQKKKVQVKARLHSNTSEYYCSCSRQRLYK